MLNRKEEDNPLKKKKKQIFVEILIYTNGYNLFESLNQS
jgi:hypothetical protein